MEEWVHEHSLTENEVWEKAKNEGMALRGQTEETTHLLIVIFPVPVVCLPGVKLFKIVNGWKAE